MIRKLATLIITIFYFSCSTKKDIRNDKNTTSNNYRPKNIRIHTQTNKKTLGPCEPSICINPINSKNIVVGSVLDYVHISNDGGLTWQTKRMTSDFGIWGDPVIVANSKGIFYYFHLSDPEGINWRSSKILDRIVVQKSNDNGINWSSGKSIGLNIPKQQDKQWACINPVNNNLYSTWTEFDRYKSNNPNDNSKILFSKSEDNGETWSTPKNISIHKGNCNDDDLTTEGAVPCSDGKNIYVTWAYDHKIWFNKSTNEGENWLETPVPIIEQKAGWKFEIPNINRVNGFPVSGVDVSESKYKGTIYINWSDQSNTNNTNVFIAKSTNKGKTWSLPKKVNDSKKSTHQFFNWMSIDPVTGYIYIVYYEKSIKNEPLINVKLSVSKNGAKNFKSYTINEFPFNPKGANFFGDYNNIDAHNGIIRPVWTQVEDGFVSIWTAIINQKDLQ